MCVQKGGGERTNNMYEVVPFELKQKKYSLFIKLYYSNIR